MITKMRSWFFLIVFISANQIFAATSSDLLKPPIVEKALEHVEKPKATLQAPYFDLPITYNSKVKSWIQYYQGVGQRDFRRWLERSNKYIPRITPTLEAMGLPKDLVYLAMIESGFSPNAESTAAAVGYWQFIKPTAARYGLTVNWWLDERRDIIKSTIAAASYLNDLYKMFGSWYLAAAAYNMGEGRAKNLIKKYSTKNYWILAKTRDFPRETADYIPKLIAAMLISKTPALYGFTNVKGEQIPEYTFFDIPGGTDLENLAYYVGTDRKAIKKLNPELTKGFVPQFVKSHRIRIPRANVAKAHEYVRQTL